MKNDFEIQGAFTSIYVKRNGFICEVLIDTHDLEKVKSFPNTWCVSYNRRTNLSYISGNLATVNGIRKKVSLHRWIFDNPEGFEIDHYNGNTFDNRRSENIRVVTTSQNRQNTGYRRKDNKSGYRGVSWSKEVRKWVSIVQVNRKVVYLEYFDDVHEAGKAVSAARSRIMPYSLDARHSGG